MLPPGVDREDDLPACVADVLWDHVPGAVCWSRDRSYLIERVLAHGSFEAIRWLRERVSNEELGRLIRKTRGRRLSARQLRFWQVILDLPDDEVSSWLGDAGRQVWDRRTG